MSVTFQVERFDHCIEEIEVHFDAHWNELARDKDKIKPKMAKDRYREVDAANLLHIVTVRESESPFRVVGYFFTFLLPHWHYADAGQMAYVDMYYLSPEYRRGSTGVNFLRFVENSLRDRGIVKFYLSTKDHMNHGRLFERLGYKISDHVYTKYLGA